MNITFKCPFQLWPCYTFSWCLFLCAHSTSTWLWLNTLPNMNQVFMNNIRDHISSETSGGQVCAGIHNRSTIWSVWFQLLLHKLVAPAYVGVALLNIAHMWPLCHWSVIVCHGGALRIHGEVSVSVWCHWYGIGFTSCMSELFLS